MAKKDKEIEKKETEKTKDKENKICLKENAPEWAKKEYEEFLKKINPVPDKEGKIIQY